jgi:hypothetical protein
MNKNHNHARYYATSASASRKITGVSPDPPEKNTKPDLPVEWPVRQPLASERNKPSALCYDKGFWLHWGCLQVRFGSCDKHTGDGADGNGFHGDDDVGEDGVPFFLFFFNPI